MGQSESKIENKKNINKLLIETIDIDNNIYWNDIFNTKYTDDVILYWFIGNILFNTTKWY